MTRVRTSEATICVLSALYLYKLRLYYFTVIGVKYSAFKGYPVRSKALG